MEAAVAHDVHGILADCGGAMACATCHVYVEASWASEVGVASPAERELLELAIAPDERSRLSCQIKVGANLDGLIVRLPARQY